MVEAKIREIVGRTFIRKFFIYIYEKFSLSMNFPVLKNVLSMKCPIY